MLTLDSIRIKQGELTLETDCSVSGPGITAVIGKSGAGKSTFLSALAGFITPEAGSILLNGREITTVLPGERGISMVFQDNNLFPHLTVFRNVALGLTARPRLAAHEKRRVFEALEEVGIGHRAEAKPASISGGEQSRAALARVLLQGCSLVLLDEPFNALGPALKAEMLDLVSRVIAETDAIGLMVTHDPEDALRVASQCMLVGGGRIAAPLPTGPLLESPPPKLRSYLTKSKA